MFTLWHTQAKQGPIILFLHFYQFVRQEFGINDIFEKVDIDKRKENRVKS